MVKRKTKTKEVKAKTPRKKMGKIKHIKTEIDGIMFDSIMESNYYLKCKKDLEVGLISKLELQPAYILQEKFMKIDGQIIYGTDPDFDKIKRKSKAKTIQAIKYIADFKITYPDGRVRIVDTKGKATADFEIKRKMFEAKYPMYCLDVIIWDKYNVDWVDYYQYKKEENARRKARKAIKTNKTA